MARKKKESWKKREGVVYSTNQDFEYQEAEEETQETLDNHHQDLHVYYEKKGRGGKTVTIVDGFVGNPIELSMLAKTIKQHCGLGGTAKDGQIIIQGEATQKVKAKLKDMGYKVKG